MKSIVILILLSLCFPSCDNESANVRGSVSVDSGNKSNDSSGVNENSELQNGMDCMTGFRKLIAESSIKKDIPSDFLFSIDDSTSTSYVIKIYNVNEFKQEVPIIWLNVDFSSGRILNTTYDPDKPDTVAFNHSQFWLVRKCFGK
jgi:hypothetical protein